jgi:hypothetical protein
MKHFVLAAALLASSASFSVFAQSSAPAQPSADATPSATSDAPAQSQASGGKTREQVYQELVESQREAQLAQPNSITHEHP